MTTIKILSDLHFDFMKIPDLHRFFSDDIDLFICAGDLTNSKHLIFLLEKIDEFINVPFLFVPGNHDYYGSLKKSMDYGLYNTEYKYIKPLIEDKYNYNDITFLGSTGWFTEELNYNHLISLNDFQLIYDIKDNDNGRDWGKKSYKFFEKELKENSNKKIICISHNAPSFKSIHSKYYNSSINECFANKWDKLIEKYQPIYWIHGHCHESACYWINKTMTICNPYGYYKTEENKEFKNDLIIEV